MAELRSRGIRPDAIVVRSDRLINEDVRSKISLFCDVDTKSVIPAPDARDIYELPLILHDHGLGQVIVDLLDIEAPKPDLGDWRRMVKKAFAAAETVTIGVVGKYTGLPDAYLSVWRLCATAVWPTTSARRFAGYPPRSWTACSGPPTTKDCTASWCPAASGRGGSKARSGPSPTPGGTASRSSASVWACRPR